MVEDYDYSSSTTLLLDSTSTSGSSMNMNSEHISTLSDGQEQFLAIITFIPSLLSVWGSARIIHMVLSSEKKTKTPYRRIMLGMSCCDLIGSLLLPLQSFLVPQTTSQRVWAIGNDTTCSVIGMVQQAFFSCVWYNGMLSFYFVLTVKFGIRETQFAQRYEPWMHGLALGYPILTAILGLGMGVYHELDVGPGCWITNYPEGCGCREGDDGECCKSPLVAWIFAGIPSFMTFIAILFNNLLVFNHVRYTIRKSRELRFSRQVNQHTSLPTIPTPSRIQVNNCITSASLPSLPLPSLPLPSPPPSSLTVPEEEEEEGDDENCSQEDEKQKQSNQPPLLPQEEDVEPPQFVRGRSREFDAAFPQEGDPQQQQSTSQRGYNRLFSLLRFAWPTPQEEEKIEEEEDPLQQHQRNTRQRRHGGAGFTAATEEDPQLARIRAVATQAFLYVAAFLLTYTPGFTLRIMESRNFDAEDEATIFPLLVIQNCFLPLAGFFNCLIYARPSYIRARNEFPQETKRWAFRRALHGHKVKPERDNSQQGRR